MLLSSIFKIGNYSLLLKMQVYRKLDVRTEGFSARIPNTSFFIIPLDYDNIEDNRLDEELKYLQDQFEIGNFYVFKTSDYGRHAVCIDALRFRDVKEIVDFSSCDLMFKKAPEINEYRTWVLRYGKKGKREPPQHMRSITSLHEGENLQSRCHAKYLLNFGVEIELKKPFGGESLEVQEYNTVGREGDV